MRILFDQGVLVPLRRALPNHDVWTAYEMGWTELSNGALLKRADAEFDVLVTTDQGIRFQQNLVGVRLAILILPTTNWSAINTRVETVAQALDGLHPGAVVALDWR